MTKTNEAIARMIIKLGRGKSEPPTIATNKAGTNIIRAASGEVIAKECRICGEMKLYADMAKNKRKKDGMNSICKECNLGRVKNYHEANRKKILEYQRNYYETNREKERERLRESNRRYREANPEKVRETVRRSLRKARAADPERFKIRNANRRAMKKALPDTLTPEEYNETCQFFGNGCALTGEPLKKCELEHAIPLTIGHGGTSVLNCYPLRIDLNQSKNDRNIFEWYAEHGERLGIDPRRFDRLISFLAARNGLTVEEYRSFVYWCHENPRTVEECESDSRHSINIFKSSLLFEVPAI